MPPVLFTPFVWWTVVLLSSSHSWAWTSPLSSRPSSIVSWKQPTTSSPLAHHCRPTTQFAAPLDETENTDDEEAEMRAKKLREFAAQARSEAEQMEINLVNAKLDKLQGLLNRQSNISEEEVRDVQNRIDQLQRYFDSSDATDPTTATTTTTTTTTIQSESTTKDSPKEESIANNSNEDEPQIIFENLSNDDQAAIKDAEALMAELLDVFNITSMDGINDPAFSETIQDFDVAFQQMFSGNMTEEDLENMKALSSFGKGLQNIFQVVAGSSGVTWGDVKGNMTEEAKETQELLAKDPLYLDRLQQIQAVVPVHIIQSKERLEESVIDDFVKQAKDIGIAVLDEPKRVGCGYVMPFQSTVKVDTLVAQLEERIQQTSTLNGKADFFFILDDTAALTIAQDDNEEFIGAMADELMSIAEDDDGNSQNQTIMQAVQGMINGLSKPSILVIPKTVDLEPAMDAESRWTMTSLAIGLTASFAADCYSNQGLGLLGQFTTALRSPIFLGIIGIQILHEIGHFLAAAYYKVEISLPFTVVPSNFGIMHTNTQFKNPLPNKNALFDFAAAGSVLGMSASIASLVWGLILTASTKSSEIATLPHVSLDFLKLSALTTAAIESTLGTDVLLSLDPLSDNVAVHPFVLAGHVGILANALNLLPAAKTLDGGRMVKAVSEIGFGLIKVSILLFLLVQGFRDLQVSNFLLVYSFFLLFQPEDLPCKNDVDKANGPLRLPLVIATTLLSLVALSPSL